jgi:hypothetical protein
MDLERIQDRIESLHKRRLGGELTDAEDAELRALYEQENEARRLRKASGD